MAAFPMCSARQPYCMSEGLRKTAATKALSYPWFLEWKIMNSRLVTSFRWGNRSDFIRAFQKMPLQMEKNLL